MSPAGATVSWEPRFRSAPCSVQALTIIVRSVMRIRANQTEIRIHVYMHAFVRGTSYKPGPRNDKTWRIQPRGSNKRVDVMPELHELGQTTMMTTLMTRAAICIIMS